MDPNNSIEVRNLTKSFTVNKRLPPEERTFFRKEKKNKKIILDSISFDIKKGEVVGILGKNGAGKSTLFKLISKIVGPDDGSIELSGSIASILELGMGFHKDMSGRENIVIKGEMYNFDKKQIEAMMDDIIDYAGIREFADNPVRTYSSGMKGKLAFSIMTHVNADILLLDETLSVGDAAFAAKAKEYFTKMSKEGHTVLLVSHQINLIENFCNRAIWIDNGKIKTDGDAKTVCAEYRNATKEDPIIVSDLANSGVAEAQYNLALMYRDGFKVEKNNELYRKWISISAKNKYTLAEVEYANTLYADGNEEEAIHFYKAAARKGQMEARNKLASLMSTNELSYSRNEIKTWFLKLVEEGNAADLYTFAEFLLKTAWSDDDKEEALRMFEKSANEGYVNAMYQAGVMYRDGIGTKKDFKKMEECFIKASECGHKKSIILLAQYYKDGGFLPMDKQRALEYYKKGALLNDNVARFQIASTEGIEEEESEHYFSEYSDSILSDYYEVIAEKLIAIDFDKSKEFYLKAAKYNSVPAIIAIIGISHENNDKEKFDEMVDKLKTLATNGNIDAIKALGNLYYFGNFVDRNYGEAKKWYRMGCERNNIYCLRVMGNICKSEKDETESLKWYEKAAANINVSSMVDILKLTFGKDQGKYDRVMLALNNLTKIGNIEAMSVLGDAYFKGTYAEKNLEIAKKWYTKGSQFGNRHCIEMLEELKSNSI